MYLLSSPGTNALRSKVPGARIFSWGRTATIRHTGSTEATRRRRATGDDRLSDGGGADGFDGGPGMDTATDFDASQGDARTGIP